MLKDSKRNLISAAYLFVSISLLIFAMTSSGQAEVTQQHRDVAQAVFDRLLEHVEKPEAWDAWPPTLRVTDPGSANAFASYEVVGEKRIPYVVVTVTEIEENAESNPDTLAFTLGHEIGHLIHDHSARSQKLSQQIGSSELSTIAVGREHELEADLYGMNLALKAGYSYAGVKRNLKNSTGAAPYCVFEGLAVTHPSWLERGSYLQQDEQQQQLWRSMAAFSNGVFFLQNEQYRHAEFCFRKVTTEFPSCYEAWANLGYALLMQYCDGLEPDDIRSFDIGHLVVGGFYERPGSLGASVRGIDEDLWFDAVGAFRDALRLKESLGLKDDLLLVKANLAVAYLVRPAGKDVGQAERLFSEVFDALQKDETAGQQIDPIVRIAILINASAGRVSADSEWLNDAIVQLAEIAEQRPLAAGTLRAALNYNQAKALAKSADNADRKSAVEMFDGYLRQMNSACVWWPLAYEQYVSLAQSQGIEPKSKQELVKRDDYRWRPVTQVDLPTDLHVGLSDSIKEVLARLGEPDSVTPVVSGTNIKLYHFAKYGLSILASHEVLAVMLTGAEAPAIQLQRPGLGAAPVTLKVGMPAQEIQQLLGGEWDVESTSLYDEKVAHQLYRDVGIAVRFTDKKVSELAVVVVPREQSRK
jgi:hypothetical protein